MGERMEPPTTWRWVVAYVARDGNLYSCVLHLGHVYDTKAEASEAARGIMENNSPAHLAGLFGPQAVGTFRPLRVECWLANGYPCKFVFPNSQADGQADE